MRKSQGPIVRVPRMSWWESLLLVLDKEKGGYGKEDEERTNILTSQDSREVS